MAPAVGSGDPGNAGAAGSGGAAASSTESWQFVGEGRGGFAKVQSYNYVGVGNGDWERRQVTTYTGWRLKNWLIVLLAILLLVPAVYLLLSQFRENGARAGNGEFARRGAHKVLIQSPTHAPFNCNDDQGWVDEKKDWCCEHYGVRCPSTTEAVLEITPLIVSDHGKELAVRHHETPALPQLLHQTQPPSLEGSHHRHSVDYASEQHESPPPFDCDIDYVPDYQRLLTRWSVAKRDWCCEHGGRGCTTPPPPRGTPAPMASRATQAPPKSAPAAPFDCSADEEVQWPVEKREYCCEHGGRGCPAARSAEPASSLPFDCDAGYAHWVHGWSIPKKAWCCDHAKRGCPSLTTSLPFDCNAGYQRWESGWSKPKKAWCCQHVSKGCPDQTSSLPFDCDIDYTTCYHCLQRRWSMEKRQWCCAHGGRGCTTTSVPFDCISALDNWRRAWSPMKIEWCCQHQGKGCKGG